MKSDVTTRNLCKDGVLETCSTKLVDIMERRVGVQRRTKDGIQEKIFTVKG